MHQGESGAAAALQTKGCDADVAGFLMHPAVLDNCLQLGAVVPERNPSPADAAFVPAGLAVYMVQRPLSQGAEVLGLVKRGAGPARKAGAATYRDHLLVDRSGAVLAVLDGLEAKQLHGAGKGAQKAAQAVPQPEVLYEVGWAVAGTGAGMDWQPACPGFLLYTSSPLAAAAGTLRALQSAQQEQAGGVAVHSTAAAPHGSIASVNGQVSTAAAAVWGMLRAFAQEAPMVTHGGAQADTLAPRPAPTSISVFKEPSTSASDGYGALVQGGAALRAVLLPSARVRQAAEPYHLMPRPRGAFGNLVPEPVPVGTAKPGWVEVQVKAVGINFRCEAIGVEVGTCTSFGSAVQ